MADFWKYASEVRWRYYEFKRTDSQDGLAPGETISSPTAICLDADGVDCSATMISNVTAINSTQVSYKLKAGTAGKSYMLYFEAPTSNAQVVKGESSVDVI
jgi:hypothetical protein